MIPKLVIFDCDGTIVDSQHMIVAAMDLAFAAAGVTPPQRAAVLSIVGLSLPLAVERLMPARDPALALRISDTYKTAFGDLRRRQDLAEPLYPGAREAILALAGRDDVVLGIATGKSRRGVANLLEREGLSRHFITIQTADTHPSKPHPSMIATAMAEAGGEPFRTVMVGDTTFDIEMARAATVSALGVAWGYHPVSALDAAGAHAIATDYAEVPALIDLLLSATGGDHE